MTRAPRKPVSPRRLDRAAHRYLERWFTTRAHLRMLLMRRVDASIAAHGGDREEAAAWVDQVLDALVRQGLLDDARFARDRARLLHRHGTSTRMIRAKLAQKGVRTSLIDDALASLGAPDADLHAAAVYVRKRRLGPYRTDPAAHRDRDLAKLGRAGFPYGVARRVLDLSDPDDVEAIELGLPQQGY